MVVVTMDEFVGRQKWWPTYCPKISNHQIRIAEPEESAAAEEIKNFPCMPSHSIPFFVQDNAADKCQEQSMVKVQIDGKVDCDNKESLNENAETEVSILTEQNLEKYTISSAPEGISTSEKISTSLAPKSTAAPSAILKNLPSSEVTNKRKDVKMNIKKFKNSFRFIRECIAIFETKSNRKRKAQEAVGEPEEAAPSAPKGRKFSNRTPIVLRPTTRSTERQPSVPKYQKGRRGKNLSRLPKNPPPPGSVAQFFGKSTSGCGRHSVISPRSIPVTPEVTTSFNSTAESGSEIAGPKLSTSDLDLDFDSFGNEIEGGKDFFDDLLATFPDVGIEQDDIIAAGDMGEINYLDLINDYIEEQMNSTSTTGVSAETESVE